MEIIPTPFDDRVRAVRLAVFVEEQGVSLAEEFDADDARAAHWLALNGGAPVGTVRLVGDRLGRLAVLRAHRGRGIGGALVRAVLAAAAAAGLARLRAAVQSGAVEWYAQRGWRVYGPEFPDAGIPHRMAEYLIKGVP